MRAVAEEGRRVDGHLLWAALRRWRVQSRALVLVHGRSRAARLALLWPQLRSLAVRRAQQLAAPAAGTTEQLRASAFDDAPVPD